MIIAVEKIVGLGIVASVLSILIKGYRPELSVAISLAAVAVLFIIVSPQLKSVMTVFVNLSEKIGVDSQYIVIAVKAIGIAYITQIGAEICRDAGEGAIGTKIETGGKIIIVALSTPVIYRLLEVVDSIINLA